MFLEVDNACGDLIFRASSVIMDLALVGAVAVPAAVLNEKVLFRSFCLTAYLGSSLEDARVS